MKKMILVTTTACATLGVCLLMGARTETGNTIKETKTEASLDAPNVRRVELKRIAGAQPQLLHTTPSEPFVIHIKPLEMNPEMYKKSLHHNETKNNYVRAKF